MFFYGSTKNTFVQKTAIGLSAIFLTLFSFGFAHAEEKENKEDKAVQLEPMVVVGEKEGTNSITLEDIENREPADLRELFSRSPSVSIGGGSVQAQKLFIRNMEDTLLSVTVDGAQQSGNLFHHQGRLTIDPELLRKVDVSSGMGGSALNGPGALAGAVKFETKSVFDLRKDDQDYGGKVKGGLYSNGEGYRASGYAYGMANDEIGFLGYINGTQRADYKAGGGETVGNTGYDRLSTLIKGSGRMDGGHNFDIGYEGTFDKTKGTSTRPNLTSPTLPDRDFTFSRNTVTVNYGYDTGSDLLNLKSTVYFTQHEVTHKPTDNSDTLDKTGSGVRSVGLDLRNTSLLQQLNITYGFDYRNDVGYIVNRSAGNAAVRDGEDEKSSVLGAYAQGEYPLFDELMKLMAGVRFDSYDYKDWKGQEFDSTGFSPNIGLAVYPITGLTVSAGYFQAHRGVGMPEVFLIGPASGGGPAVSNDPDMKAEEAENYELRLDYQQGWFYGNAALYQQTIRNVIPQTGTWPTWNRTNLGKFENEGYEILIGARYEGAHAAVGVADSKPELNGERITEQLGVAISTGRRWTGYLDYAHEPWGLVVGWSGQYLEKSPTLTGRGGEFKKDAYDVHNVYAKWAPASVPGLDLGLRIDNLFDKKYLDQYHFSYDLDHPVYDTMLSPGRSISLNFGYEF